MLGQGASPAESLAGGRLDVSTRPAQELAAADPVEAPRHHRHATQRHGAAERVLRVYPALESPAFRLIWLGTLQSMVAWQMSVVASGYAALVISGSATTLGLVSSAVGLPLLLSPIGGVAADRFPRRTILLLSQAALGLGPGALGGLAPASLLGGLRPGPLRAGHGAP